VICGPSSPTKGYRTFWSRTLALACSYWPRPSGPGPVASSTATGSIECIMPMIETVITPSECGMGPGLPYRGAPAILLLIYNGSEGPL
jgi:hypothetical protein